MEYFGSPGFNRGKDEMSLFKMAMNGKWSDVVDKIRENPFFLVAEVTRKKDTLLELAVSEGQEKTVREMINIIKELPNPWKSVRHKNNEGNTALHLAAMVGNVAMCECIASVASSLIGERNHEGETPLFTAVLFGKKQAFQRLYDLCPSDFNQRQRWSIKMNGTGDTILHYAIFEEHFDLALRIIESKYGEELVNTANEDGITPLHLLAKKPWAFPSGSLHLLGFCRTIIYHCIFVDEYEVEQNVDDHPIEGKALDHYPKNYKTCIDFFLIFWNLVRFVLAMIRDEERPETQPEDPVLPMIRDEERPETQPEDPELSARNGAWKHRFSLAMYGFYKIFKLANRTIVMVLIALGIPTIRKIYEKKRKHKLSIVIMKKLLTIGEDEMYEYYCGGKTMIELLQPPVEIEEDEIEEDEVDTIVGGDDQAPETPILIAARNGISEIVEELLEKFPIAIYDVNKEKKNAMLLAVQNRQPHVFLILLQKNLQVRDRVLRMVDESKNNLAHLAATLEKYRPWLIPGEALQMQWEMKWFEFVTQSIPSSFLTRRNGDKKTPVVLFIENHDDLVRKGSEWLVKTSESYSVVAALIATVAFATSTTVPGGVKDNIGTPTLENRTPFHFFAISSLIALCFSVTALVTFLSILTSRYKAIDFGKDLPKKLLMGLTSLFLSIAAMLISFCSGHLFEINGKLKYVAYTVYAATCLPVTLFAAMQFPLYFDLIGYTFSKVPRRSDMPLSFNK